ncbi:hypothetical protein [Roseimaritima ulvae]|uniref:hypothetical protein n=1 Tax=Roseimaritima ulvae TaxID=980254 RepID=UPI0012F8BE64|nr:hypothetical protein [Roseimaritima ulvae]
MADFQGTPNDSELQSEIQSRRDNGFNSMEWVIAVTTGKVTPAIHEPGTLDEQITALDLAEQWALATNTSMAEQWEHARSIAIPHAGGGHDG